MSDKRCTWTETRGGLWFADCPQKDVLQNMDIAHDASFVFCPFCGVKIDKKPYQFSESEAQRIGKAWEKIGKLAKQEREARGSYEP
jgi:hypothetical protein